MLGALSLSCAPLSVTNPSGAAPRPFLPFTNRFRLSLSRLSAFGPERKRRGREKSRARMDTTCTPHTPPRHRACCACQARGAAAVRPTVPKKILRYDFYKAHSHTHTIQIQSRGAQQTANKREGVGLRPRPPPVPPPWPPAGRWSPQLCCITHHAAAAITIGLAGARQRPARCRRRCSSSLCCCCCRRAFC